MAYQTGKRYDSPPDANLPIYPPANSSQPSASSNPALAAVLSQFFNGGNLGGGPTSPDLATLAPSNLVAPTPPDISKPEAEAAIARMLRKRHTPTGPVQQDVAPEYDDGNLAAINALMELAGSAPSFNGGGVDIAAIMKQAAGAAGAPFRAQIQSTKNQNQRAKADTDYGSKQIRKMFNSLARSNRRAAGRESDQSMDAAQEIQSMSQASADDLAADNQARLDASAAQSAALGSGDLAATLAADVNANTSEGARQLVETAGNASNAVAQRGQAERRFLNRSAGNAKLTGTNRAADLYGDLQDYLQGNRDKIGELRGQQAAAAGAARQSAAASAASAQSDLAAQQYQAHQDLLENQMALLGMKTGLQQQDFENNMSMEELALRAQQMSAQNQPEAPLIPGFDNRLVEALPDEQRSALLMQQFLSPQSGGNLNKLMENPALSSGFYTNEEGQPIPLGGNPLNSQQLLEQLGMTSSDPQQNYILSQIIAQLASANTDLPYGAQR